MHRPTMLPRTRDIRLRSRDGATLPIVAICIVMIIGCAAIAVDLGMLYNTRSEAQRAADAGALAGAAALASFTPPNDSIQMVQQAVHWATANRMLTTNVAASEVTSVDLIRDSSKVRVTITRPAVDTWFAGIWGVNTTPVTARAAARVYGTGTVGCLKPFAFPDDTYSPADYGRLVEVYITQDDGYMLIGFGGGPPGLGNLQPDIALPCNDRMARISIGDSVWVAPDDTRVGQIRNGFDALIASDPMTYDESTGLFYRGGQVVDDWRASPRVANVAMFDPTQIGTGTQKVKIVNFASVYFSHRTQNGNKITIWGRLYPIIGEADDCMVTGNCAPNAFRLRLVD